MHEAYARLSAETNSQEPMAKSFNDYGYGTFISGPSKTADIAQVLVMGAQAARSATVLLLPE
jgi:L-lactate dehydrogenase complex protein LldG